MGSMPIIPDSLGSLIASLQAGQVRQGTTPLPNHSTIQDGATTVIDGNNEPRVAMGLYTWPHGPHAGASIYALVAFDAAGNPIVVLGQQPDGSYGLGVYDTGGNKINEQNASGFTAGPIIVDGLGLHAYDTGGHERIRVGQLPSGDFGLAAYSAANDGTYDELQPIKSATVAVNAYVGGAGSTVTFGGPSITATVGASGRVLVTLSADMIVYKTVGTVYLFTDGAEQHDSAGSAVTVALGDPSETQEMQGTVTTVEVISGLSAGSHTFTMEGNSGTSVIESLYLSAVTLTVQPL